MLKDSRRESQDASHPERVGTGCSGRGHLKADTTHQGRSGDRRATWQARAGGVDVTRSQQGRQRQQGGASLEQETKTRHTLHPLPATEPSGQQSGASSHSRARGGNVEGFNCPQRYSRHLLVPPHRVGCLSAVRVYLQCPPPSALPHTATQDHAEPAPGTQHALTNVSPLSPGPR